MPPTRFVAALIRRVLARVYGDMLTLLLSALEMHGNMRYYILARDPDDATTRIRKLPVVFPRIEVTDNSALLCLTIELRHIASDYERRR